ncbi:MAG: hypothetical protein MRZ79_24430 [Bacteroidia bacterium]|nr:hypothetical protein [Bacteroidia bacterium]
MHKPVLLTRAILFIFVLAFGQGKLMAQMKLFDISVFDERVLELGYKEDSILLADEISFLRQEAQLRRGLLADDVKTTEISEDEPITVNTAETPKDLKQKRLEEFPIHIRKTVPQDAIFMEVDNGEGISTVDLDGNKSLLMIEDKYNHSLSLRFQKLRISTLVVRVYGHDGRLVYNNKILQKPKGFELVLNTQSWNKGIYRIQFKIDDGRWQEKVMVKNSPARKGKK